MDLVHGGPFYSFDLIGGLNLKRMIPVRLMIKFSKINIRSFKIQGSNSSSPAVSFADLGATAGHGAAEEDVDEQHDGEEDAEGNAEVGQPGGVDRTCKKV